VPLMLQRVLGRMRSARGDWSVCLSLLIRAFGASPCPFRNCATPRRRQFNPGSPRLGQPNGNSLFCRTRAVLSFADMVNFLPHELSRLG
jgi:hypothetical protein